MEETHNTHICQSAEGGAAGAANFDGGEADET